MLVFRSFAPVEGLAPLLHLGGGGPGSPVYLDYPSGAHALWANHDDMSLNQGRDLYIIDPRGTGLSKPLLNMPDRCGQRAGSLVQKLERGAGVAGGG